MDNAAPGRKCMIVVQRHEVTKFVLYKVDVLTPIGYKKKIVLAELQNFIQDLISESVPLLKFMLNLYV